MSSAQDHNNLQRGNHRCGSQGGGGGGSSTAYCGIGISHQQRRAAAAESVDQTSGYCNSMSKPATLRRVNLVVSGGGVGVGGDSLGDSQGTASNVVDTLCSGDQPSQTTTSSSSTSCPAVTFK